MNFSSQKPNQRRIFKHITPFSMMIFILIGLSMLLRLGSMFTIDLLPEEAYYWNYAKHLDFGYLDHPPMVALLIKLTTSLFGTNEWGVRCSALICWFITVFFSFKLTHLLKPGAGPFAVFLISILPYFFIQSLIITPDEPLLACWSATLYFLYRALILDKAKAWIFAGISMGLGMLSKYSIALLGLATLIYLLMTPSARRWLCRKEPSIAAFIAALLFTPVIYWNATHEWISFAFQSTHRLQAETTFTLHQLLGLFVLFLMPPGLVGFWALFFSHPKDANTASLRFLRVFTLVPLVVFAAFSMRHDIKFNWIGPGLLALIPWLALLIHENLNFKRGFLITAFILIPSYTFILGVITFGTPAIIYDKFFIKFIDWEALTQQVQTLAHQVELKTNTKPTIIPLDHYFIGSELSFYQAKLFEKNPHLSIYPIIGRHVFGEDSLMYQYWSKEDGLKGKPVLLISIEPSDFTTPFVTENIREPSPIHLLRSHSQGQGTPSSWFRVMSAISNASKSNN